MNLPRPCKSLLLAASALSLALMAARSWVGDSATRYPSWSMRIDISNMMASPVSLSFSFCKADLRKPRKMLFTSVIFSSKSVLVKSENTRLPIDPSENLRFAERCPPGIRRLAITRS